MRFERPYRQVDVVTAVAKYSRMETHNLRTYSVWPTLEPLFPVVAGVFTSVHHQAPWAQS
jgi:hypothetical protein